MSNSRTVQKIKMGMVGGGPGAFIGEVHRKAARMDGKIELMAGAFDINPEKSRQMGEQLCLNADRVYGTYSEMIAMESRLPQNERIDFISITTPNNTHFPIARDFLNSGFNVICEKPMTLTVDEAKELQAIVKKTGKIFGLMHNYTGYPMVKLAKDMVQAQDLGEIRKVIVQYPQGWLATAIEQTGQQQASWRTDPKQSGAAGCMGDIGSHAENLTEYITGLKITELCADLTSFVKGRRLDDDGSCLIRLSNGAKGVLHASQIAVGQENNLAIWVHGEKASLEWHQENPNYLYFRPGDGPVQVWNRGNGYVAAKSPAAARATRLPFGHPEGFIEAFANVYCNFADCVLANKSGTAASTLECDFPSVDDGLRGMVFIDAVVESSKKNAWVRV